MHDNRVQRNSGRRSKEGQKSGHHRVLPRNRRAGVWMNGGEESLITSSVVSDKPSCLTQQSQPGKGIHAGCDLPTSSWDIEQVRRREECERRENYFPSTLSLSLSLDHHSFESTDASPDMLLLEHLRNIKLDSSELLHIYLDCVNKSIDLLQDREHKSKDSWRRWR